jgi:pyrophosphatase PpaX
MYKYILFDWDGNIAKTLDIWLNAVRVVTEKRGIYKTDEEIATSFGAFPTAFAEWGVLDVEAAMHEADKIAKQTLPDVELYPGVLPTLSEMHASGRKLALITSSTRDNIHHLLEKHGIVDLFDAVITWEDVTHAKPHPEPLEKALAAIGGAKDKAVMIGDSEKDIGAANNLGIDSILFHSHEHKKFYDLDTLKTYRPTHVVTDFKEVLDIV